MNLNSSFPSFKELREILHSAQKNRKNRIIQINYASGLQTVVEQECNQLKLSCKVIPFSTLRCSQFNLTEEPPATLFGSYIKKITSFLIALNLYGSFALFIADLARTTTNFCLKKSELSLLKGKVGIHTRKRKKYQALRNIIIVQDLTELSNDDFEYVSFLASLIREKYISRTLLVIFQNQNNQLLKIPDDKYVYSLDLTAEIIKKYLNIEKEVDDGIIQIINLVGIQYLEVVFKIIDCRRGNEKSVEKLIAILIDKLSDYVPVNKTEINSFLKVCSLLFERFCLIDLDSTSPFQESKYKKLLTQCIEGKLLHAFIPDAPLEYAFVENFIREYYRENSTIVFAPQVYRRIFDYLKNAYPQNYTDIALLSGLVGLPKYEILSFYIIAYYHDKFTTPLHKKQKVVAFLQSDTFGNRLIQLEHYYRHIIDTPRKTILGQCYELLEEILVQKVTLQAKLCALNFIATLVYELETAEDNRLKVMDSYRELLTQTHIFSEQKTSHSEYMADAVLFSTCIENNYQSTVLAQRLIELLNNSIGEITSIKSLRLFRLGNALYPTDILKGLEFTKKAYILSQDLVVEHEFARINYSASLIVCGEYVDAAKVLRESDFAYSALSFSTELSLENNRLIAEYFSESLSRKRALYQGFKQLYERIKDKESSDINIVKNNYVSACLVTNYLKKVEQMEKLCQEIENSGDTYHMFFAAQNRLVLYYLTNNKAKFSEIKKRIIVPSLMRAYENFFEDKASFMYDHFNEFPTMEKLHHALTIWAERYSNRMFRHFTFPVPFGLIERWFE